MSLLYRPETAQTIATQYPCWDSLIEEIDRTFEDDDDRQVATHIVSAHLMKREARKDQLLANVMSDKLTILCKICKKYELNLAFEAT